jgi:hypothetical protein
MRKSIIQDKKKENPFQLFFLDNDETKNVKIIELNKINFEAVTSHLEKGVRIFIIQKQGQKSEINTIACKITKEHWYFIRS